MSTALLASPIRGFSDVTMNRTGELPGHRYRQRVSRWWVAVAKQCARLRTIGTTPKPQLRCPRISSMRMPHPCFKAVLGLGGLARAGVAARPCGRGEIVGGTWADH